MTELGLTKSIFLQQMPFFNRDRKIKIPNFIALIFLLVVGLSGNSCAKSKPNYQIVDSDNPVFIKNTEFKSFENLNLQKFNHLIEKYQLDTVLKDETDEFKRILLLRNWIRSVIRIEDYASNYRGEGYAEGILDAALEGDGFHCAHFMRVQNAVMNGYGYITRIINSGPGAKDGPDGNHGINEIWSNNFQKWFLSDAKYNHHFEKKGLPLSALEIRDEYIKNKAADVILVKGPNRTPTELDSEFGFEKERFAQTYTWIKWYINGNPHSIYPEKFDGSIMVLEDDFFKNNVYYRDGAPVSQRALDSWKKIKDRKAFEWTPNIIDIDAEVIENALNVHITSETPNLKTYELREGTTGAWKKVESELTFQLSDHSHEYFFRTVNLANVPGPETKLLVREQTK